jgi:hypothetical protein
LASERDGYYQTDWQAVCESVYWNRDPPGLAALKELYIDMKDVDDRYQRTVELNRIVADPPPFSYSAPSFSACGAKIETLDIRNLACNSGKELVDALSSLGQLTTIFLPLKMAEQENIWDDWEGQDKHRQGLIWELGRACPKLREVRTDGGANEHSHASAWLRIERDRDGGVKGVEKEYTYDTSFRN